MFNSFMKKMAKRISMAVLALAALLAFAACGNNNEAPAGADENQIQTQDRTAAAGQGPVRGVWDDNVFTSDYLGFTFNMPASWVVATDAELQGIMELGAAVIGEGAGITEDMWDAIGLTVFTDFMASNPLTGANVSLLYERLVFPATRMTAEDYIQVASEQMAELGWPLTIIPGTTRIGNYDWHSYSIVIDLMGIRMYNRTFLNIHDGFVRMIQITYSSMSESWEEILNMFD